MKFFDSLRKNKILSLAIVRSFYCITVKSYLAQIFVPRMKIQFLFDGFNNERGFSLLINILVTTEQYLGKAHLTEAKKIMLIF